VISAVPAAIDVPAAQAELAALGLDRLEVAPVLAPGEALGAPSDAAFQGPAPLPIAEPLPMDRSSPRALLDGALAALAAKDPARLARLSRDRASHPQLTEDDAADAQRRFLSSASGAYWARIAEAVAAGRYRVEDQGQTARVLVEVGGAAGTYRLELRQEDDGWYLAS
jgi:hypothetical protein